MTSDEQQRAASGEYRLLTGAGPAAIAVIRLRGAAVPQFLRRHVRCARSPDALPAGTGWVFRAELLDPDGQALDDILVSVHGEAPTPDIRLHLHGSPWLVRQCTELLAAAGFVEAREADAPLWHAENAIQAEAFSLLPRMLTLRGVQWLLRQSRLLTQTVNEITSAGDIEVARQRCEALLSRRHIVDWFTRPLRVAIVGPPNAGKSTLVNALADREVSLVSHVPGTTRDWVEVGGEIDGFPVIWLDTAGLRESAHELEAEGIRRTRSVLASAEVIVVVLDATASATGARSAFLSAHADLTPACVALNKMDVVADVHRVRESLLPAWRRCAIPVSALARLRLGELRRGVLAAAGRDSAVLAQPGVFTARQERVLHEALASPEFACQRVAAAVVR